MSAKESAKYLPSLDEGISPVDPDSVHITLNTLCDVLTTAAVLKNNVFTNTHHHLMDCNLKLRHPHCVCSNEVKDTVGQNTTGLLAGCSYGVNETCFDPLGGHHQVYRC